MALNKDDIQHIAQLARLELSEAELNNYGSQLSGILQYIDQLQAVDTSALSGGTDLERSAADFRSDEVVDWEAEEVDLALRDRKLIKKQLVVQRVLD